MLVSLLASVLHCGPPLIGGGALLRISSDKIRVSPIVAGSCVTCVPSSWLQLRETPKPSAASLATLVQRHPFDLPLGLYMFQLTGP